MLIEVKYFCITVYYLGYSFKTDTTVASASQLDYFSSLEDAIEGCNKQSRCDLIYDGYCDGDEYAIYEGTTTHSDYGHCTYVRKNIILIFDTTN